MKFKLGDKVKFLNDIGGGIIVSFQGKSIALVKGDDEFETPVLLTELVLDNATDKFFNEIESPEIEEDDVDIDTLMDNVKKEREEEFDVDSFKERYREEKVTEELNKRKEDKLFLALEKTDQNINLYLVNDTDWDIVYHISEFISTDKVDLLQAGLLDSGKNELICTYKKDEFNEIMSFGVQVLSHKQSKYKLISPLAGIIKIKPIQILKENNFRDNSYFPNEVMLCRINKDENFEEAIAKLSTKHIESESGESTKKVKPKLGPNKDGIEEIDLHIENIIDNYVGMSNKEILDIQMGRFETSIKGAILSKNTKKIVFIHGVGNGRLKHELRRKLDRDYSKYNYQDASFKQYGYGATMIILKK